MEIKNVEQAYQATRKLEKLTHVIEKLEQKSGLTSTISVSGTNLDVPNAVALAMFNQMKEKVEGELKELGVEVC